MINIIFTPPILWALSSRISTHLLELLTCLYVLIIFKCCCSTSWAAAAAATYSLFYGLFYTKLCLGDDTVVRMTQRNQGSQPPSATLTREWFPIERFVPLVESNWRMWLWKLQLPPVMRLLLMSAWRHSKSSRRASRRNQRWRQLLMLVSSQRRTLSLPLYCLLHLADCI